MLIFFFFQAEDGIRDLYVTGVQTCALPISAEERPVLPRELVERLVHEAVDVGAVAALEERVDAAEHLVELLHDLLEVEAPFCRGGDSGMLPLHGKRGPRPRAGRGEDQQNVR